MMIKTAVHGARVNTTNHLEKGEINETITITGSRGLVHGSDIHAALMEMEACAAATGKRGVKNWLVHASINPDPRFPVTEESRQRAWDLYEKAHGLEGCAFIEVEHHHHERSHWHRVYLGIDPQTQKAVRMWDIPTKNLAAGRVWEYEHGHPLQPCGQYTPRVVSRLRSQGNDLVADAIERSLAVRAEQPGHRGAARMSGSDKERIDRGVPVAQIRADLIAAWREAAGPDLRVTDPQAFVLALHRRGLELALGDGGKRGRAAPVVVSMDGHPEPILRTLKKADPDLADLRKADIDRALGVVALRPLADVRADIFRQQEGQGIDEAGLAALLSDLARQPPPKAHDYIERPHLEARRQALRENPLLAITAPTPEPVKDADGRMLYANKPAAAEDRGVFGRKDIVAVFIGSGMAKREAETLADEALRLAHERGDLVNLSRLEEGIATGKEDPKAPMRYCTREFLLAELEVQDRVRRMHQTAAHGVLAEAIEKAIQDRPTMKPGQERALRAMLSDRSVVTVSGYAGAGKSWTVEAAVEVWESAGYRVRGTALSGIAAKNLEGSKVQDCRTAKALLLALERGDRARAEDKQPAEGDTLGPRDVVVIDEAAMLDNLMLRDLLRRAEEAGAKAVLIGDSRQLQSVAPGQVFALACRESPPAIIDSVTRQKDAWARDAVEAFGRGEAETALRAYDAQGCIRETGTRKEAVASLAAWSVETLRHHAGEDCLVLAETRADVLSVNTEAQRLRRAAGEVEEGVEITVQGKDGPERRSIGRGDKVMITANDRVALLDPETLEPARPPEPTEAEKRRAAIDQALASKIGMPPRRPHVGKVTVQGGPPRRPTKEPAEIKVAVQNGLRGTCLGIRNGIMAVRLDDGRVVGLPAGGRRPASVDLAYAVTVHKSQGLSVEHIAIMGGKRTPAELAYVALSRAKRPPMVLCAKEDGGKEKWLRSAANWKPNAGAIETLEANGLTRAQIAKMIGGRDEDERDLTPAQAQAKAAAVPTARSAFARYVDKALQASAEGLEIGATAAERAARRGLDQKRDGFAAWESRRTWYAAKRTVRGATWSLMRGRYIEAAWRLGAGSVRTSWHGGLEFANAVSQRTAYQTVMQTRRAGLPDRLEKEIKVIVRGAPTTLLGSVVAGISGRMPGIETDKRGNLVLTQVDWRDPETMRIIVAKVAAQGATTVRVVDRTGDKRPQVRDRLAFALVADGVAVRGARMTQAQAQAASKIAESRNTAERRDLDLATRQAAQAKAAEEAKTAAKPDPAALARRWQAVHQDHGATTSQPAHEARMAWILATGGMDQAHGAYRLLAGTDPKAAGALRQLIQQTSPSDRARQAWRRLEEAAGPLPKPDRQVRPLADLVRDIRQAWAPAASTAERGALMWEVSAMDQQEAADLIRTLRAEGVAAAVEETIRDAWATLADDRTGRDPEDIVPAPAPRPGDPAIQAHAAAWRDLVKRYGMTTTTESAAARASWIASAGGVPGEHAVWRALLTTDPKAASYLSRSFQKRGEGKPERLAQWEALEAAAGPLPRTNPRVREIAAIWREINAAVRPGPSPAVPIQLAPEWAVLQHEVAAMHEEDVRGLLRLNGTGTQGPHRDAIARMVRTAWTEGRPGRTADAIEPRTHAQAGPRQDPVGDALRMDRDDAIRPIVLAHLATRLGEAEARALAGKVAGPQAASLAADLRQAAEEAGLLSLLERREHGSDVTEKVLATVGAKRLAGLDEDRLARIALLVRADPQRYGEDAVRRLDDLTEQVRPGCANPSDHADDLAGSLTDEQRHTLQKAIAVRDPIVPPNTHTRKV